MKIRHIFLALIILVFLNSCTFAVTNKLWERPSTGGHIDAFFLDREEKRVVLVGVKNPQTNLGMNYSITDKTGQVFKVFEIGARSDGGVYIGLDGSDVSGSKVRSNRGWVSFKLLGLAEEDTKFLKQFNESPKKNEGKNFGYYYGPASKIIRYSSSEEKFSNICSETNKDQSCSQIIKTTKPWEGYMKSTETLPSFFGKLLLMPFTLVADILLTPVNAIIFVSEYHHDKPEKQKLSDK